MANIRQTRRQIVSQNYRQQLKRNKVNSQLLKLLFIQVLTIVLTILSFIVYRLRASFTSDANKSQFELAQGNFLLQISTVISHISHAISFYLFTLASTIFRRELLILLNLTHIPVQRIFNRSTAITTAGHDQSNTAYPMRLLNLLQQQP